jgi:hypothetical protein
MFENFPAYSNFIFLKKIPPFQRCGTHHVCMAHIKYALLIGGLLVAHIVYAPRIALTEVRPVGPRWGPHIINGAYFLICATKRENIHGAFLICDTNKTWRTAGLAGPPSIATA